MQAYLWDGKKQIKGELSIEANALVFDFEDFADSDLHLQIPLTSIVRTLRRSLYGVSHQVVEVVTTGDRSNAFVLEGETEVRWLLDLIADY